MKPKMRAIDMALRLNLDEEGNPKPQQQLPYIEKLDDLLPEGGGDEEPMPILIREEEKDDNTNRDNDCVDTKIIINANKCLGK